MPAATTAYDRLTVGARFVTPARTIATDAARDIIRLAGYTHPMFAHAGDGPVPGQLTLLFLGGLAEQTDLFDETTLALVSLDDVAFRTAVRGGDTIRLEMEVTEKRLSESGRRGFVTFAWTCKADDDRTMVTARATFAFRTDGT